MSKNKYFVIGGGLLLVVVITGLVIGFWPRHQTANLQVSSGDNAADGSASQKLDPSIGGASIPLNQALTDNNASSGGLAVTQASGTGLGQTAVNPDSGSASTGSSAPSTPKSDPFDPTTFAQYDKYKTSNGALFGDVQTGNGDTLTANKKAAVYYKGWLTNGKLFDQSQTDSKGQLQPFVFTEGAHQVISGWEQGLDGMKVGGTRLLIVPPSAGYGATGQGSIPPNAVLVFEVQLAAVQ